MSKRLINVYKSQELLGDMVKHAFSAARASDELEYANDAYEDWRDRVALNTPIIARVHEHLVEVLQYFAAYSEECQRPLAREHDTGSNMLKLDDGEQRSIDLALLTIEKLLGVVQSKFRVMLQKDFTEAEGMYSNDYGKVTREVEESRRRAMKEALSPIQDKIDEVNQINAYFDARFSKQIGQADKLFPELQTKFLGQDRSR